MYWQLLAKLGLFRPILVVIGIHGLSFVKDTIYQPRLRLKNSEVPLCQILKDLQWMCLLLWIIRSLIQLKQYMQLKIIMFLSITWVLKSSEVFAPSLSTDQTMDKNLPFFLILTLLAFACKNFFMKDAKLQESTSREWSWWNLLIMLK